MGVGERSGVVVGEDLGEGVPGADFLAVDDAGNVEGELRLHLGDGSLELLSVIRLDRVGPLQTGKIRRVGQRSVSFWILVEPLVGDARLTMGSLSTTGILKLAS